MSIDTTIIHKLLARVGKPEGFKIITGPADEPTTKISLHCERNSVYFLSLDGNSLMIEFGNFNLSLSIIAVDDLRLLRDLNFGRAFKGMELRLISKLHNIIINQLIDKLNIKE